MTDFVRIPDECPDDAVPRYLTKGKAYEVREWGDDDERGAEILDNDGDYIYIGVDFECAHLDDACAWIRCDASGAPVAPPLTPRESEILALLTSDVTPISDAVEQVVTMLQEARQ